MKHLTYVSQYRIYNLVKIPAIINYKEKEIMMKGDIIFKRIEGIQERKLLFSNIGEVQKLWLNVKYVSGISLTEEWIRKLGFVHTTDNLWEYNGIVIESYLQVEDHVYVFLPHLKKRPSSNACHYVHDLQNLYHALTKDELELPYK